MGTTDPNCESYARAAHAEQCERPFADEIRLGLVRFRPSGYTRNLRPDTATSLRLTIYQARASLRGRSFQGWGKSKRPDDCAIWIALKRSLLHSPTRHTKRQRRQSILHSLELAASANFPVCSQMDLLTASPKLVMRAPEIHRPFRFRWRTRAGFSFLAIGASAPTRRSRGGSRSRHDAIRYRAPLHATIASGRGRLATDGGAKIAR